MLIRVNETTWVPKDTITKIEVGHANFFQEQKLRFSVIVKTNGDDGYIDYTSFFDEKKDAIAEANKIADFVNRAEMMT